MSFHFQIFMKIQLKQITHRLLSTALLRFLFDHSVHFLPNQPKRVDLQRHVTYLVTLRHLQGRVVLVRHVCWTHCDSDWIHCSKLCAQSSSVFDLQIIEMILSVSWQKSFICNKQIKLDKGGPKKEQWKWPAQIRIDPHFYTESPCGPKQTYILPTLLCIIYISYIYTDITKSIETEIVVMQVMRCFWTFLDHYVCSCNISSRFSRKRHIVADKRLLGQFALCYKVQNKYLSIELRKLLPYSSLPLQ